MSEYMIEIEGLQKQFGKIEAVKDVSLKVEKGKIYGLLGPNGAGKSTTIRMICGVITPSGGQASVNGHDVYTETDKIKDSIGYMSQKFSIYEDLTVYENMRFFSGIYSVKGSERKKRIDELIEMADLSEKRHVQAKFLSGGWKQRLALCCALIHKPQILILDEPTAGVDPVSRRVFWKMIYSLAAQGITILVTTHYMDEAESCDEISFIFEGRTIEWGTPKELIEKNGYDNLEDVFIGYVEKMTGEKVISKFDKVSFLHGEEV
ncbi:MAG: ABC transporter ATP-binding protein [Clostridia bacterium]|nr:ABC transporter ATP-binding protein [Clostridia bacterium]